MDPVQKLRRVCKCKTQPMEEGAKGCSSLPIPLLNHVFFSPSLRKILKNVVGSDRGGSTPPSLKNRVLILQLQAD